MARGLFSGLVFGSVLAVVGLGAVSLISPLPQSPDVGGDPDGVAAPVEAAGDTRPAGGKDADLVEAAPKPPAPDAGGDSLSALDGADTDPAARPELSPHHQPVIRAAKREPEAPHHGPKGGSEPTSLFSVTD